MLFPFLPMVSVKLKQRIYKARNDETYNIYYENNKKKNQKTFNFYIRTFKIMFFYIKQQQTRKST